MRIVLAGALLAASAFGASNTPIADVAMKGDLAAVRTLVKAHPGDVNAPQPDGSTALLWAAYWNDTETVKALLAAGANVNASNRDGYTPLSQACTNGDAALVEMLLKAGADANSFQAQGQTVLMTAARAGSAEVVKLLLDHGAEVNSKESWRGQSALMWATAENHPDVVQVLVDHGAEVNAVSSVFDFSGMKTKPGDVPMHFPRGGFTALLFAARGGFTECAKILLDHGADIAIADLAVEASRLQSHCFDPRQSSLHSLLFLLRRLTDILRTKVDRTGEAGPRSSKTRAKPVRPVDRKVLAQRKRS